MTGPVRCRKRGAGTPIPDAPPVVEVLPPSDRNGFVVPVELELVASLMADGDFRGCVEPIEQLFFARRNTLHQGLLQYCVALLQLRRGMIRSPRRLLRQALEFWHPYPEWQDGLDLAALRAHAETTLQDLPSNLDQVEPEQLSQFWRRPPCPIRRR